jgi:hypothetical protein
MGSIGSRQAKDNNIMVRTYSALAQRWCFNVDGHGLTGSPAKIKIVGEVNVFHIFEFARLIQLEHCRAS